VKIADFGLSRAVGANSDYYKAAHGGRWPVKWSVSNCGHSHLLLCHLIWHIGCH